MKDVCMECKWRKPKSDDYCYCVKYGTPIRYGRIYCISYEKERKNHEADNIHTPDDGYMPNDRRGGK